MRNDTNVLDKRIEIGFEKALVKVLKNKEIINQPTFEAVIKKKNRKIVEEAA